MNFGCAAHVGAILLSLMACAGSASAQALDPTFTYQGRLEAAGVPVDGTVDLECRLFATSVGGSQIGSTVSRPSWPVVAGELTTPIDFGPTAFDGQERYLQIAVRSPAGSAGPFVTLTPRQRIAPTPYAMVAKSLVPGANLGIGTVPNAHTPLTFSSTTGSKISLFGNATQQYGMGVQNNAFQLYTDSASADFVFGHGTSTSFTERMRIEGSGNVGIGTNAPTTKLDVVGTGRFTGFQLTGNGAAAGRFLSSNAQGLASWVAAPASQWSTTGANISFSGGNVGIGTTTPSAPLSFATVAGGKLNFYGNATTFYGISIAPSQMQYSTDTPIADHVFGYFAGGVFTERARITGAGTGKFTEEVVINEGGVRKGGTPVATNDLGLYSLSSGSWLRLVSNGAPIRFFTNGTQGTAFTPASNSAVMSIGTEGNVGIGTDSPVAKLDVAGTARVDILEIDAGADLAERFDVSPALMHTAKAVAPTPGMVVSISGQPAGTLVVSDRPYDRRVAGIISGAGGINPGLILGQPGTMAHGEHPVACAGRVWCLVDASFGPVQPGDLLTTSPVPGHAMRVGDFSKSPGSTVGKAMTALPSGRGLVLVLVSLQ